MTVGVFLCYDGAMWTQIKSATEIREMNEVVVHALRFYELKNCCCKGKGNQFGWVWIDSFNKQDTKRWLSIAIAGFVSCFWNLNKTGQLFSFELSWMCYVKFKMFDPVFFWSNIPFDINDVLLCFRMFIKFTFKFI